MNQKVLVIAARVTSFAWGDQFLVETKRTERTENISMGKIIVELSQFQLCLAKEHWKNR